MIDLAKLENARSKGNKLIAACPACRAEGYDRRGEHLIIYPGEDGTHTNGKFGCVAHQGDHSHNQEIYAFIGCANDDVQFHSELSSNYKQKKSVQEYRQREAERLTQHIRESLKDKLAHYLSSNWRADLFHESPIQLEYQEAIGHDFLKSLYRPDDILWMGDVYDTGHEKHRANFRTCQEWLEMDTLPPRIASGTFREKGVFSRASVHLKSTPYIVIESDNLIGYKPITEDEKAQNKRLSAALFRYAEDKMGLTLRAVIDTGNRSLHAWCDRPTQENLNALKKMAAGLCIDSCIMDQGQAPLRMPGCIHEASKQAAQLFYLNPISYNATDTQ